MIPRKKKKYIMIVSILVIITIIICTLMWVYINTDMLKSDETLFAKYMGKNVEIFENLDENLDNGKYDEFLKNNKYTNEIQVKVNHIGNKGTSSENTNNDINKLTIDIKGESDYEKQYKYQDIKLLNTDEQLMQLEYIEKEGLYGLKFSDLFGQYILTENSNLDELLRNIGYSEESISKIPTTIEFNQDVKSILKITDLEKDNLKTKYMNIVRSKLSSGNFSSVKNQTIDINGKGVKVNSYSLTLTKEQLNDIYIRVLEEVKQDEKILSKFDELEKMLLNYQIVNVNTLNMDTNIKDKFVTNIENIIKDINKNNIGQDETKVTVYENMKKTVRTEIVTNEYTLTLDSFVSDDNNMYLKYNYKHIAQEKENIMILDTNGYTTKLEYSKNISGDVERVTLSKKDNIDASTAKREIIVTYEDDDNRVSANITENVKVINEIKEYKKLTDENSIDLTKLNNEQVKSIVDKVILELNNKIEEIYTKVNKEELENILEIVGIVENGYVIQGEGITEVEKNRFNSQFEIIQGIELDATTVVGSINSIRNNLFNMKVVDSEHLNLEIDRQQKNEEIADTLIKFIEDNKNEKYNIKVEYNNENGLVDYIVLEIVKIKN